MAFASFGIILPMLSVVLSVFMLGLSVGSWAGGRWIPLLTQKTGWSAAWFYGGTELVIGLGAFAVPKLFAISERVLLSTGQTDSFTYLLLSALALAISILPWCLCMGTTFPFMMAYIREWGDSRESFSFLYLANVLGAMCGTFLTAVVWIEMMGFRHSLWLAAAGNFTIAFISGCLGWEQKRRVGTEAEARSAPVAVAVSPPAAVRLTNWILFSTGFVAMAMEVVWTRAFTPTLKTQVYSFAMIVFTYLGATFLGSWMYRRDLRANRQKPKEVLIPALAVMVFLPVLVNNPRIVMANYWEDGIRWLSAILLLASIVPFCALLGYLTPSLIDESTTGNPTRAGRTYAINVLGCILGPLFACYVLLPRLSGRYALILLSLPFLVFCFHLRQSFSRRLNQVLAATLLLALAWSVFGFNDFEGMLEKDANKRTVVRRDYTATVISFDAEGCKFLLVNGIGMTSLTPITKFMVHLPLAFCKGQPESALVICFGMGTTYRSALSWNIDTTAVELVPSVTKAFDYYHADAARCASNPKGHIIIDDGRRFLRRTDKKFDVIVVDPPPPVEAAGSSLLFSREFYLLARQHLKPGGIVQMWFPGGEVLTAQAVVRSIHETFPYVRCFPSIQGWGIHLLASEKPIEMLDADQLLARMPESARRDLLEWKPAITPQADYINQVLTNEYSLPRLLNPDLQIQITDDQPYNEYFLLRRLLK
jgi:spermidine synthase